MTVPVETAETTLATVLFADMRGYTAIAEQLPPARVVPLLDEFFRILGKATEAHGGEVFYMAGDGMMAGFGVREADHRAREALAAGRAMLEGFATVAARWKGEMAMVAGIGVGLHLGEVALGFLGPPGKESMTMVGDTANVAARLCGRARTGELLMSSAVVTALQDDGRIADPASVPIPFLQLPQFALRGRSALLDIWCVPARERVVL